jgi:RNA polymerase sigma factor (sigma-70 family)
MTERARNELVVTHQGVVREAVRGVARLVGRHWEREELEGWGYLILMRAVEEYDAERDRGMRMRTFLYVRIRQRLMDQIRVGKGQYYRKSIITPPPVFVPIAGDRLPAKNRRPEEVRLLAELDRAVEALPVRWRLVITMLRDGWTQAECSRRLGVNESRVSQIRKRAVEELRKVMVAA